MANIWTVNSGGGADFTTIQAAINAASPGDTIIVAAGLYPEQITIDKSLTVLGAQAGVLPIEGTRPGGESILQGPVPNSLNVTIAASNIILNGFEIANFFYAIQVPLTSFTAPDYIVENIDIQYNYMHSTVAFVGFTAQPGTLRNLTIANNIISVTQASPALALAAISLSSGAPVGPLYENITIIGNILENIEGNYGLFSGANPAVYLINTMTIRCNYFRNITGNTFNIGNIKNGEFSNNLVDITGGLIGIDTGVIYGNTFTNGALLTLWGSEAAAPFTRVSQNLFISYNNFTDAVTGRGIRLREGVLASTIVITLNAFLDSGIPPEVPPDPPVFTGYLISNNGTGTVDATNNWWDDPLGPAGNTGGVYGLVTTTPFLSSYVLTPSKQTTPGCWPLSTIMALQPGFWIYPTANQLLYSTSTNGSIVTVGNTLGLWGQFSPPSPVGGAFADGIGAFITTNPGSAYDGFPLGTTELWQQNSSANSLTLPSGSTILRAFLFYSATQKNSLQDVSGFLNEPVTFTPPSNTPISILPDSVINIVAPTTGNIIYHAVKDVTAFMEGTGSYEIGSVPGVLGISSYTGLENNFAGWTIAVIYKNADLPLRNLSVWDEFEMLFTASTVDIPIAGFVSSPAGTHSGTLFIAAGNGDNYVAGDQVLFGPNSVSLTPLSGANNGTDNFYQSQINDDTGALLTTGTFGTSNQPYGGSSAAPTAPAARQGWDKTAVNVSSTLTDSQTSGVIRLTDPELYFPQYVALQNSLATPVLAPVKKTSKTAAKVGDVVSYTITFTNTGSIDADNIIITDAVPTATSYVVGTITSNVPITGDPNTFMQLTTPLAFGETATIRFDVSINTLPSPNPMVNVATVDYSYIPAVGVAPIPVTVNTNTVSTLVFEPSRGVLFI